MTFPLELIAGVDVTDRQREAEKSDRQHDDVHHGTAPNIKSLCDRERGTVRMSFDAKSKTRNVHAF
jgi:hypothetical protein